MYEGEAIKLIDKRMCFGRGKWSEHHMPEIDDYWKAGQMAIKALEKQQWIPCSERLPEEDFWSGRGRQFSNHVLITIANHANDDEQFTDIAQTVDGIWQLSHDVDGDCSLPNWCEVTAWMPLPEPYKGEES